jgi:hypothetical protein
MKLISDSLKCYKSYSSHKKVIRSFDVVYVYLKKYKDTQVYFRSVLSVLLTFKVSTALNMSVVLLWIVTPCDLVGCYQCYGLICCVHLQGCVMIVVKSRNHECCAVILMLVGEVLLL